MMNINNNLKLWLLPIIPLCLFVFIAICVCSIPQVTAIDISIIKFLQKTFSFISNDFLANISNFFKFYSGIILFIVTFILVYKKDIGLNLMYAVSIVSSKNVYDLFKHIVQRQRPPLELQHNQQLDSFSFPSGHSYCITVLFGVLIYVIFRYCKNNFLKYTLTAICVIMILLVIFSRLLLGVHYPTDVIAGFLLGLTTVFTICLIDKQICSEDK